MFYRKECDKQSVCGNEPLNCFTLGALSGVVLAPLCTHPYGTLGTFKVNLTSAAFKAKNSNIYAAHLIF
jgi:hypothetical protein